MANGMIAKTWLAAVLGVLLGVGIAYTAAIPNATSRTNPPLTALETQPTNAQPTRVVQANSQLILVSLLAGIVVAAPVFVLAKKHA